MQSRITIVDERQDFPFQYKEGAHTWFSDAQDYCKDIDLWLFILARETSYWVFVRAEWE
ncbi:MULTISPECIES: hypothetical protein [Comamonas]|uniref:hypothetical protein n=1 Tax=Comamonas TaxID=283 RepID=UPI0012E8D8BC|nr:hypothetical protein [Comamonas thiooxydans]